MSSFATTPNATPRSPLRNSNGPPNVTATQHDVYTRLMKKLQRQANYQQSELEGLTKQRVKTATTAPEEEDDEEKLWGLAPAPPTLRAIIDNIHDTIGKKLDIASVSTVKDAMKLLFECRGMLDKLLRDLPTFTHLKQDDFKAQDLFFDLRKTAITLPQVGYTKNEFGKYLPEVRDTHAQLLQRNSLGGSVTPRNGGNGGGGESDTLARSHSSSNAAVGPGAVVPSGSGRFSLSGSGTHGSSRDLRGGHSNGPSAQQAFLMSARDAYNATHHMLGRMDATTQTVESQVDTVDMEAHAELLQRCRELEIRGKEYEYVVEAMKIQVDATRGAMLSRAHTVQYLRSTLFKDASVLRTQLQQARGMSASDVNGIHSLLDMVLLAVEKQKQFDSEGNLVDGPDEAVAKMKLEVMNMKVQQKKSQSALQAKYNTVVAEKNRQIKLIRGSLDVGKMQDAATTAVKGLRIDFDKMQKEVEGEIEGFKSYVTRMLTQVEEMAKKNAQEMVVLRQSRVGYRGLQEAVKAVELLFTPMLQPEYAKGVHPWPYAKQHDPFVVYVTHAHGSDMAATIIAELESLHRVYRLFQNYIKHTNMVPDITRPSTGRVLVQLVQKMISVAQVKDIATLREALDKEQSITSAIARCNFQIKSSAFISRRAADRSHAAMQELGVVVENSANSNHLPARHYIKRIKNHAAQLQARKKELELMRKENAQDVYRMWRELNLDISERAGRRTIEVLPVGLRKMSFSGMSNGSRTNSMRRVSTASSEDFVQATRENTSSGPHPAPPRTAAAPGRRASIRRGPNAKSVSFVKH